MTCQTCNNQNNASSEIDQASKAQGVTYDEGNGVKTNIIISGPMSEVLTEQLSVIFKKQPIATGQTQDAIDLTQIARETHANQIATASILAKIENEPDNAVRLHDFDVKSIKDHMNNLTKEKPSSKELQNPQVNVVAGRYEQLLDGPSMSELLSEGILNEDTHLIMVEGQSDDQIVVGGKNGSGVMSKLFQKARQQSFDEKPVTEKIDSLNRVYGDAVTVHAGVEAFVRYLIKGKR